MSGDTAGGRPGPEESRKRPRPLARARVGWPRALRELKDLLYEVYLAAGAPSLDEIAQLIAADDGLAGAPSRDTVRRVISDPSIPPSQADAVTVATVLARQAVWDVPDLAARVRDLWVQARMAQGAGRPIGDLRGDVRLVLDGGLGVHPALDIGSARDQFGILPTYIPREHDARLKTVVDEAMAGRSGIAVLVGGSSTGKTRALWEAVSKLPDGWRLWHPLSPTAPDAALAALPDIAPKTVVWLNEAQNYLVPDPLGEQVAAGLRELLNDPSRAPILVLGTLWPEHWNTLTTRTTTDRHAGARELLGGHKIDVPDAFTPADLAALDATDPRLVQAARHATSAQITQYLAGVPYLIDRFESARGAALALIHAAMDARRLGAGPHIPLDWLADAATGYLSDADDNALEDDWLPKALAYATTPCNGIPGILTPVNPRRARNQRNRRPLAESGSPSGCSAPSPQSPHFLLADYLEQHGRRHRAEEIPPVDFWTAAAHHAHPTDLTALGNAALDRGLYRDAAQLHKQATSHSTRAATPLVRLLHDIGPGDLRPAHWVASQTPVDDPIAVGALLSRLCEVGGMEHAGLLAARAAAHRPARNLFAMAALLPRLQEMGEGEQADVIAARVAAEAPVDDPIAVAGLVSRLRAAGAQEQAGLLAVRVAATTSVDSPYAVVVLLARLREVGAQEQADALAARAAATAPVDSPAEVAGLLSRLPKAGKGEQADALIVRAVADAPVDDPGEVAELVATLWEVGAQEQAGLLAARAAAEAPVDNPGEVAELLTCLREVGEGEQADAWAARIVVTAAVDDPGEVAELLATLWEMGAQEQVGLLAARAAADAPVEHPIAVAELLTRLREVGAQEQADALAVRAAAHTPVDDPFAVAGLLSGLREMTERGQAGLLAVRAATEAPIDSPGSVAGLPDALRAIGETEQAGLLAVRAANDAPVHSPAAVAVLLSSLREMGEGQQADRLAVRAATEALVDNPGAVAELLASLWEMGAQEQADALAVRAAAHTPLDDPNAVAALLDTLRDAGAHEQADVLSMRLPGAGRFYQFIELGDGRERFKFGREPDGSAVCPWTWDDLE